MIETIKALGYRTISETGYKVKTGLFLIKEDDKEPLFVIQRLFLAPSGKKIQGAHILKQTKWGDLFIQEMVFLAPSAFNIQKFLSNIQFIEQ